MENPDIMVADCFFVLLLSTNLSLLFLSKSVVLYLILHLMACKLFPELKMWYFLICVAFCLFIGWH